MPATLAAVQVAPELVVLRMCGALPTIQHCEALVQAHAIWRVLGVGSVSCQLAPPLVVRKVYLRPVL